MSNLTFYTGLKKNSPKEIKYLVTSLKKFFKIIEKKNKIRHKLNIVFRHQITLRHKDSVSKRLFKKKHGRDKMTFGWFSSPRSKLGLEQHLGHRLKGECTIVLPVRLYQVCKKSNSLTAAEMALINLLSFALHEFGHYTQFRDKKRLCEDDIDQRTAMLARKLWDKKALFAFKGSSWYKHI